MSRNRQLIRASKSLDNFNMFSSRASWYSKSWKWVGAVSSSSYHNVPGNEWRSLKRNNTLFRGEAVKFADFRISWGVLESGHCANRGTNASRKKQVHIRDSAKCLRRLHAYVNMKTAITHHMTTYRPAEKCQCFADNFCLHHHGHEYLTERQYYYQKAANFTVNGVKAPYVCVFVCVSSAR